MEFAIRRAIEDLIADYAHCIDNDQLEEWSSFFTDPCVYAITTRENHAHGRPVGIMRCESKGMLEDRIRALRNANIYEPHVYRHLISAPRIGAQKDGAYAAQTSYAVIRTMQEGAMSVFSAGTYLDKVVFEDGMARFRERIVVCDSERVDTLIVIPI